MSMDYAEDKLGPKNSEDYIRFLEAELEAAKQENIKLRQELLQMKVEKLALKAALQLYAPHLNIPE